MKTILFYDATSRIPYTEAELDLDDSGIDGTEATLIRVALELSSDSVVIVAQARRSASEELLSSGIYWRSAAKLDQYASSADAIIVLRRVSDGARLRLKNHKANIIVWYHDWYPPFYIETTKKLKVINLAKSYYRLLIHSIFSIKAIAVSNFHEENLRQNFRQAAFLRFLVQYVELGFIYNPVVCVDKEPTRPVDSSKMIFFSGPTKGLTQVLANFAEVRKEIPEMRLVVASPGYEPATSHRADGVEIVGSLNHEKLFRHVKESLCVFYPANLLPETFGLVFAESHVLGTPVLAHRFGAAVEILSENEFVDATQPKMVAQKVADWRSGNRPVVTADPRFDVRRIADKWRSALWKI